MRAKQLFCRRRDYSRIEFGESEKSSKRLFYVKTALQGRPADVFTAKSDGSGDLSSHESCDVSKSIDRYLNQRCN
jgi:hypothetical protein